MGRSKLGCDVRMKTNYTTKQFALYLRKLCEKCDDEWHFTPRAGVEDVRR